tara:strand:- start:68 stop:286 length:219 start_codon:yes stop_codon:yes gene_type:complete
MKFYLFLIYEIVFLMLIALIIYYAELKKNLKLSLGLNKIILFFCILNVVFISYNIRENKSICEVSQDLFCKN